MSKTGCRVDTLFEFHICVQKDIIHVHTCICAKRYTCTCVYTYMILMIIYNYSHMAYIMQIPWWCLFYWVDYTTFPTSCTTPLWTLLFAMLFLNALQLCIRINNCYTYLYDTILFSFKCWRYALYIYHIINNHERGFSLYGLIIQQCIKYMSVAGLERMTTGSVASRHSSVILFKL